MSSLHISNVRKAYGSTEILKEINIDVEDGDFLVLVGPSGCGKSTLLSLIAGLDTLSGGEIRIGNDKVNDLHPSERDIAMVFQSYALYPHMTVYENMAFALHLRKLPRPEIDQRVHAAAEILGITPMLGRRPRQLSGGQRQRVAIGRAIVRQPRVFLFDEPLSNLDAKLRVQMRREIARIRRELSATVVYVTHDQVEAMTLGDRIVVMNEGRVEQIGSPLELYDHPLTLFVATFIGSPAMNLVEGQAQLVGTQRFVTADDSPLAIPLTTEQAGRLAAAGSDALVAGIRPEDVRVSSSDGPGALSATVEASEPLGNEVLLYLRAGKQEITARAEPHILPRPGDRLSLTIDPTRVHYFDRTTGKALTAI
jgi:multiple sugar transport system ATP-binding protein